MLNILVVALLAALVTCASADCDASVAGKCYSQKTLIQGFRITDQLAIDRKNNILYTQFNDNLNTAIFLDEPKIRLIHVRNSSGMAVDQATQILYTGYDGAIYGSRYEENGYTTDMVHIIDDITTPAKLHYADTLYTVNTDGSSGYFSSVTGEISGKDNLEDYDVTDMTKVINTTTWVFVADGNVYKFIWYYGEMSSRLITENRHVLSTDKYGDVYIGDGSAKVIYKLDRDTEDLRVHASYENGSVEDFVFDRDNNIVFRDADGSIGRWVPENRECMASHRITDFTTSDNLLIDLIQNGRAFN